MDGKILRQLITMQLEDINDAVCEYIPHDGCYNCPLGDEDGNCSIAAMNKRIESAMYKAEKESKNDAV